HGNPNVLTPDVPSSRLSQATTAQHAAVEVEKWTGPVPELVVDKGPELVPDSGRRLAAGHGAPAHPRGSDLYSTRATPSRTAS
ncbi:hypothetical protein E1202_30780, partial [Saccharopolyspora karakumensis]